MSARPTPNRRPSIASFAQKASAGEPIVMITAYDVSAARLCEAAGVDAILVGDSLGMTVLGHDSTLPVTMDDMVRATAAVSRGARDTLIIADMPFMSYQVSRSDGMRNAARLMVEGGAQAVKVEGATPSTLTLMTRLSEAGVPVMGHLGLTPQSVNTLGGYKTQAVDVHGATKLVDECRALERAGAFAVVLECIPAELASLITATLTIPTIGIGAGAGCHGQVQVYHDILGLGDFTPKHAMQFAQIGDAIVSAVSQYAQQVRAKSFPTETQSSHAREDVSGATQLGADSAGQGDAL